MAYSNPLFSAIQARRPAAGLYPGSGVAQGGQQGRMAIMHNGIGGVHAGHTGSIPGRAPGDQNTSKGPRPNAFLPNNGANGRPILHPPAHPIHTTKPTPPGTRKPIVPGAPVDPFARYEDSSYFDALQGLRDKLNSAVNPLLSKINSLNSRYIQNPDGSTTLAGVGKGQTVYDMLLKQSQDNFNRSLMTTAQKASSQGLLHSGALGLQKADLGNQYFKTSQDLYNTQGQGALDALNQQQLAAQQDFTASQSSVQRAAIARALARQGQNDTAVNSIYSSIFPKGS